MNPAMMAGEAKARVDVGRLAGKYLTFLLAGEEYGVPVLKVREIMRMLEVTPVPQAPPHVRGVINLRGKVIPVVDLRIRFGFPPGEYDERTCIVVMDVALQASTIMMGVVVDAVSDAITVARDEIEETPEFGDRVNTDFIRGVAKVRGAVRFLLDLDLVFNAGLLPA